MGRFVNLGKIRQNGRFCFRTVSKVRSLNISCFDAFERNVQQTARFVGLAIPLRNAKTLWNWQDGDTSMSAEVAKAGGNQAEKYIKELLEDLESGGKPEKRDVLNEVGLKLQSSYISSVFGFNWGIVLKQLGSIPMAAPYLGWSNFPKPGKVDTDLISKYTQELAWRGMGYATPETKTLKENPSKYKTSKGAQFVFGGGAITWMDSKAAGVLWPWAENKVAREFPDLEVGTQEMINSGQSPFYKKVAEEFNNAVARSQSVSDEMHQSTLRKSKNAFTRGFTMFRSDSAQAYNAFRQMLGEAAYYKRIGDKKMLGSSQRKLGWVIFALILNALWGSAVDFGKNLFEKRASYYRDEDGELTVGSVASEMAWDMFSSLAGTITWGDTAADLLGSIVFDRFAYDSESLMFEQFNNLLNDIKDSANEGADGNWLGAGKIVADSGTMLLGLPVANFEKTVMGVLHLFAPQAVVEWEDLFDNPTKANLKGLTGEALQVRIGNILDDRDLECSDESLEAVAALYEEGYTKSVPSDIPSKVTIDGEEHTLSKSDRKLYGLVWNDSVNDALDELTASDVFKNAESKTQARMLQKLYDHASNLAKAEVIEGYKLSDSTKAVEAMMDVGLSLAQCMAWSGASQDMKSGEKAAELEAWELAEEAKKAIFTYQISGSYEDEIVALEDAGLPFDEFLKAYSIHQEIDGMDLRSGEKALEFSHWINAQPYNYEQATAMRENMLYWNMTPASAGDYDDFVQAGVGRDNAKELVGLLNELKPEDGEDSIADVQKWRVCVDFPGDAEHHLTSLSAVMDDKQFEKVERAWEFGVKPELYVYYHELRESFDANGNGSYSQAEVTATIDAMGDELTNDQKAALWQIVANTNSAKNNPYSTDVGQKVIDARSE